MSQEFVEEYLEHHRNPSNKDMGNMILEWQNRPMDMREQGLSVRYTQPMYF